MKKKEVVVFEEEEVVLDVPKAVEGVPAEVSKPEASIEDQAALAEAIGSLGPKVAIAEAVLEAVKAQVITAERAGMSVLEHGRDAGVAEAAELVAGVAKKLDAIARV